MIKKRNENVDRETHAALRDKYFIIISAGFIDRRELLQISMKAQAEREREKKYYFAEAHKVVHVKIKQFFFMCNSMKFLTVLLICCGITLSTQKISA
jgi:hypothetical protein